MAKEKKSEVVEKIMEAIDKDEVKMKPRIYFILGSVLMAVGFAGTVVASMMLVHLVLFRLKVHAPMEFLRFGRLGLRPFMSLFPWIPLVLSVGSLIGGLLLLRKYDVSYKKSFAGLVVGLIVLVIVGGVVLDRADFGERMANIKSMRGVYVKEFLDKDWVVGQVVAAEGEEFTVVTPHGEKVEVVWSGETILAQAEKVEEGDMIRVVGNWENEQFVAKGIIKGRMDLRFKENFRHTPFPVKGEVRGRIYRRF